MTKSACWCVCSPKALRGPGDDDGHRRAVLQELAASADDVVSAMAQQAHDEPYPDSDLAALAREGEGRR